MEGQTVTKGGLKLEKKIQGLKLLPEYADVTVEKREKSYLINGTSYQRVTTALNIIDKPGMQFWAVNQALASMDEWLKSPVTSRSSPDQALAWAKTAPQRTSGKASDRGTETHALVERIINEGPQVWEEVPLELVPAVNGAVEYLSDYGITVIATEQTVWSNTLKVAGTFDGMGFMGDKLVLFDWKRSKAIYWNMALQLGVYSQMVYELTGAIPDEAHVVRLSQGEPNPDGKFYEARVVADLPAAYEAYVAAFNLHTAGKAKWWTQTNNEAK